MLAKRERQAVKRNSAAEMADVVEADVRSEPVQNARKVRPPAQTCTSAAATRVTWINRPLKTPPSS